MARMSKRGGARNGRTPRRFRSEPPAVPHEAPAADEGTTDDVREVELSVPLDTVCYLVARAHDLMGKTASTSDEDDTGEDDDPETAVLEDRADDPVEIEMRSAIDDLNDDAQIDLVALMWLGRDDGDWAEIRAIAEQEHNEATADYLCGTPLLADYLLAGLERIGRDCDRWFSDNL